MHNSQLLSVHGVTNKYSGRRRAITQRTQRVTKALSSASQAGRFRVPDLHGAVFKIYRRARVGFAASHFQCLTTDATGRGRLLYTLPNYIAPLAALQMYWVPPFIGRHPDNDEPSRRTMLEDEPSKSAPPPGRSVPA